MIKKKNITILAIETSCDDTGIAIVKTGKNGSFNVLSNIVSSQEKIHSKWGGVYPMLAKREHQNNLVPVLISALKQAKLLNPKFQVLNPKQIQNSKLKTLKKILEREPKLLKRIMPFLRKYQGPDIDAIAVTTGPGLEPCLWVGVNFAKVLAYYWNLPVIPVNHIEGHVMVNFIDQNQNAKIKMQNDNSKCKNLFPAICLVVSGGHTQIILMRDFGKYEILGETRDDAAGECFDKTARILGLGYPGGPAIAKLASEKSRDPISTYYVKLPRPMLNTKDYDFSFSGLKTAVLYEYKKQPRKIQKNKYYIQAMANDIQQSIIDVLIKKTIKASKDCGAKTIILGGGVTANKELRKQFAEKVKNSIPHTQILIPESEYCTDNGLMIAVVSYFKLKQGKLENWKNIEVNANLRLQ